MGDHHGQGAVNNNIVPEILLYISAIFWTLSYDTIYGAQDMSDDEIIGLKSTSIKFKKNIGLFVSTSYLITIIFFLFLFKSFFGLNILIFFSLLFILILIYQLKEFYKNNSKDFLKLFKLNNYTGLTLFIGICSINL